MLSLRSILFLSLLVVCPGCNRIEETRPGVSELSRQLVGTWILMETPGAAASQSTGRLKFFTGRHWIITQADSKSGEVVFLHGGTYTLAGDILIQQVDYAKANTMNLVGLSHRFRTSITGDTLIQIGIDNPWKETWKRLK